VLWWSVDRGMQYREDPDVKVQAAPLIGEWDWRPGWGLVPPALLGIAILIALPRFAHRLHFRSLFGVTAVLTSLFAVVLAASDGWGKLMDPVVHPTEYWANLDTLPPPRVMLEEYATVDFLLNYSVHVKGHPPGFLLLLQAAEYVGLGSPWVNATIIWISIGLTAAGVLRLVQLMSDDEAARRCAPFLVLAPYAVWMATSADATFAAMSVWGVTLLGDATLSTSRRLRWAKGVGGGLLSCFAIYSSYGSALYAVVALIVLVGCANRYIPSSGFDGSLPFGFNSDPSVHHSVTPGTRARIFTVIRHAAAAAVPTIVGALMVVGLFAAFGFWWFDGFFTTKDFYEWGTAQFRLWQYFIVANIAALIIAVGPATVVGLGRLGKTRVWYVVGGGVATICVANGSLMSKAEVERIWLLFMVLLTPAAVSLKWPRLWLAAQLAVGLLLQAWLVSKW
jgi:methylthioxylose transferase